MKILIFFFTFSIGSQLFATGECEEARNYLTANKDKILAFLIQAQANNANSVVLRVQSASIKNEITSLEDEIADNNDSFCERSLNAFKSKLSTFYGKFVGGKFNN